MGFQFELLQEFSNFTGLELELIAKKELNSKIELLENGKADIIATNMTITKERKNKVDFTIPIGYTRQILVQRKAERPGNDDGQVKLIRNQLDLAGQKVFVKAGSSFADRLRNLSEEIGQTIYVIELNKDTEDLIEMVSEGKIDYTVCDENVAVANSQTHDNIDIQTAVSFPQYFAWAVRKGDTELLDKLNHWLETFKKSRKYKLVYSKYYESSYISRKRESEYFIVEAGKVSRYDEYIRKYAGELGWDWRLLAALIYQESRFNPNVKSWAGATGLMQLMPRTAEAFGVEKLNDPEQNIQAGVGFLKWLNKRFDKKNVDPDDKIKFILAAYNAGFGHLEDAMKLAQKFGKDPRKWDDNVALYVLNKANPKYFNDPVVKYGYCRGEEPFNYVRDILNRYEHYKNIIEK